MSLCRNPVNMGIFAISKSFFVEIGEYDDDMFGWGGDNVDLSLRVNTTGYSSSLSPQIFTSTTPELLLTNAAIYRLL